MFVNRLAYVEMLGIDIGIRFRFIHCDAILRSVRRSKALAKQALDSCSAFGALWSPAMPSSLRRADVTRTT